MLRSLILPELIKRHPDECQKRRLPQIGQSAEKGPTFNLQTICVLVRPHINVPGLANPRDAISTLRDQIVDDFAVDISETVVAALESEGRFFVVHTEQMQNRRL